MKTRLTIAILFLVAVLGTTMAHAQSAIVHGNVLDIDGKPLAGAVVEYSNNENGRQYKLTTDKAGHYHSLGISAGRYTVKVTKEGQPPDSVLNYPIGPGDNADLDFDLRKAATRGEQQ